MEKPRSEYGGMSSVLRVFKRKQNEEKLPFARDAPATKDNGAILKPCSITEQLQVASRASNHEVDNCADPSKEEDSTLRPMSTLRKVCFYLSFNVWFLYFATFIWLLPCSFYNCPGTKKWNVTIDNIDLTTDFAVIGDLLIFGFRNNSVEESFSNEGSLIALNSTNGRVVWITNLRFVAKQVYCRKSSPETFPDCLAVGDTEMVSFKPIDGNYTWKQDFVFDFVTMDRTNMLDCGLPESRVIHPRKLSSAAGSRQYKVLTFDIITRTVGQQLFSLPTDCEEVFLNTHIISFNANNDTYVVFTCIHSTSADLWMTSSKVCPLEGEAPSSNTTVDQNFSLLYSIKDFNLYPADILLVDAENHGIVVSWSNTVVLISKDAPHDEIWRHVFYNASTVAALVRGHYTSKNQDELAVIMEDENQKTTIYVLTLPYGTMTSSVSVSGRIKSVSLIPGNISSEADLLVVEMEISNSSKTPISLQRLWTVPQIAEGMDDYKGDTAFYRIGFEKTTLISLITASSFRSKAVVITDRNVDLILAETNYDSGMTIADYILKSSAQKGCVSRS